ncbi:MAG: hypothetical protein AB4040_19380 [Synechococcus sp.]
MGTAPVDLLNWIVASSHLRTTLKRYERSLTGPLTNVDRTFG